MKNDMSYFRKHPIKSIVLIEVCFLLLVFIAGAITTIKQLSIYSPILLSFIPTAFVLIIYFTWKRKWSSFGFKPVSTGMSWFHYLPLLIILIVLCFQGFDQKPVETIAYYVFFAILVGFVEESIYRGIMIKILLPLGLIPTIVTSSFLFSLSHILNILSGQNVGQTAFQIVYAFLVGVVLAQLLIKNSSIYPLILFHTLHNLILFLGKNEYNMVLDGTVIVILAITGVYLALSLSKSSLKSIDNEIAEPN